MRLWAISLGLALWCYAADRGVAAPRLFPDNIYSLESGPTYPERLHPAPFWVPSAQRGYQQRFRMFLGGITRASWSIEINETDKGGRFGVFRSHDGHAIDATKRFQLTEDHLVELRRLAEQAGLWTTYPQFYAWNEPSDVICVDGLDVVFERVDAAGYRYSEGNAQCTLGAAQLAFAAKLLQLAGRSDLERLLH